MDRRQTLMEQCLYYRGQDKSPFSNARMNWFWEIERIYVVSQGRAIGESGYYEQIGGKLYPSIPYELLMVMFTSWGKSVYSIKDSINAFYELVDEYLSIAKDHH